ncbi:unnamed protein product [Prunus armeniaca]
MSVSEENANIRDHHRRLLAAKIRAETKSVQSPLQRPEPSQRTARGEPLQALQAPQKQLLHARQEPLHLLRSRTHRLRDLPYVPYCLPYSGI